MSRFRFSLKYSLCAVTAICIMMALARYYYVANTIYELRALVRLNFIPFADAKEVDNVALFARVNVSAPGVRFFSGNAMEHFKVNGRESLRCCPGMLGVTYSNFCCNNAELTRAKSDLLDEIEDLLQRNKDMDNYGYRVIVITYPPYGEKSIEELHDTLQDWPVGHQNPDGRVQTTAGGSD